MENIISRSNISFADIQKEFNPDGANKIPRDPISINDYYNNNTNINAFVTGISNVPYKGSPISIFDFFEKKKTLDTDWLYTLSGKYKWICPIGIININVVCIGTGGRAHQYGGGGGGGGLAWANNISVTPGTEYTISVGGFGSNSYFNSPSVIYAGSGGDSATTNYGFNTENEVVYIIPNNYVIEPGGDTWYLYTSYPVGIGGFYNSSGNSYGGGNGVTGGPGLKRTFSSGGAPSSKIRSQNGGASGNAGNYTGNGTGTSYTGTGLYGLPDTYGNKYGGGIGYANPAISVPNGAIRIMYSTSKSNKSFPNNAGPASIVYTNLNPI